MFLTHMNKQEREARLTRGAGEARHSTRGRRAAERAAGVRPTLRRSSPPHCGLAAGRLRACRTRSAPLGNTCRCPARRGLQSRGKPSGGDRGAGGACFSGPLAWRALSAEQILARAAPAPLPKRRAALCCSHLLPEPKVLGRLPRAAAPVRRVHHKAARMHQQAAARRVHVCQVRHLILAVAHKAFVVPGHRAPSHQHIRLVALQAHRAAGEVVGAVRCGAVWCGGGVGGIPQ